MSTCASGGVHVLPEDEESWSEADADALMAACLDKCQPCQAELSKKLSREPNNEAYGKLFTTFVITGTNLVGQLGIVPRTGADLWPGAKFERATRDALAGVKFAAVRQPGQVEMVAVGWPDAAEAARTLARMSRQDRLVVLADVMDMVVGVSAMREGGMVL